MFRPTSQIPASFCVSFKGFVGYSGHLQFLLWLKLFLCLTVQEKDVGEGELLESCVRLSADQSRLHIRLDW